MLILSEEKYIGFWQTNEYITNTETGIKWVTFMNKSFTEN